MPRLAIAALLLILLAGCASTPRFSTEGISAAATPRAALLRPDSDAGRQALWGGVIIDSRNLEDRTLIEVLAYPLDSKQRPNTAKPAAGRFLAVKEGYLETADYSAGRLITVRGTLREPVEGKVGEANYRYPVLEIADTELWAPEPSYGPSRPRVSFGIGVILGN